jgi:hypothetical protein
MTLVEFSAKKYYQKEKGIQTSYRHNGMNLKCVNGVWVFEKRYAERLEDTEVGIFCSLFGVTDGIEVKLSV